MLEVHKKCHEGEELVLKCQFCLEEVIDNDALKDHEATHSGPKPYLCTICGKTYKKRETMVRKSSHIYIVMEFKGFVIRVLILPSNFNSQCVLYKLFENIYYSVIRQSDFE